MKQTLPSDEVVPSAPSIPVISTGRGMLREVLWIVPVLCFTGMAIVLALANGLCCGDDAYLANVGKNLAQGLGYSSSVQPWTASFALSVFDPFMGTGPTVILPASVMLRLAGNTT